MGITFTKATHYSYIFQHSKKAQGSGWTRMFMLYSRKKKNYLVSSQSTVSVPEEILVHVS